MKPVRQMPPTTIVFFGLQDRMVDIKVSKQLQSAPQVWQEIKNAGEDGLRDRELRVEPEREEHREEEDRPQGWQRQPSHQSHRGHKSHLSH